MSKKYEKQKRKMADPTPARLETESKSYREEAEYDVDNALFEISLYRGQFGNSLNLRNAIKHLVMAIRCHDHSEHLAGNTLEEFIAEKQEAKAT